MIRVVIIPAFFPLAGTEKYVGEYSECSRLLECHANVACQICRAPATLWNIFVLSVSKVLQERYTYENPYMYMYTIFMYIFICMLHIFLGHVRTTTPGTSTVHYQPATATLDTAPARFWSDPAACLATVVPDSFGSAKTNLHNFQTLSAHCNNALGLRPCLFARSGGRMLYFSICKHILRCKR